MKKYEPPQGLERGTGFYLYSTEVNEMLEFCVVESACSFKAGSLLEYTGYPAVMLISSDFFPLDPKRCLLGTLFKDRMSAYKSTINSLILKLEH